MPAPTDLSVVTLFLNAGVVVKIVMGLLLGVSFMSWWFIFQKFFAVRLARQDTDAFEKKFWSGADLVSLFHAAQQRREDTGALERIFEAGFREFMKLRQQNVETADLVDGTQRAMRATYQREMDALEAHLSFLASVGSVSPYVGLFGTVWGIMHAFQGLASVGQATLAQVAPGIAEALVATAIGLFAAIPAVLAYNRFASRIDRLSIRFESFTDEFSNILRRQGSQ